jgi:hypothetical protein
LLRWTAEREIFVQIEVWDRFDYATQHWERLQWLLRQVNTHPRPSNHAKIYGSGYYIFGTGGPEEGVE